MEDSKIRQLNTDVLAYIGDSAYDLYVREMVLESGKLRASSLHRTVTGYVNAHAQADAVRGMLDELTDEEQRLVKRARNHKVSSRAKNSDPRTYKWATGFEALVGYLYLIGEEDRLTWVMNRAVEIIDGK
ncbi:MAG: ribonuclease III [Firmicutes bacterium]|nr:ribonuclease III [Bacillota bacterium]